MPNWTIPIRNALYSWSAPLGNRPPEKKKYVKKLFIGLIKSLEKSKNRQIISFYREIITWYPSKEDVYNAISVIRRIKLRFDECDLKGVDRWNALTDLDARRSAERQSP